MLPLIAYETELELRRTSVDAALKGVFDETGKRLEVPIGTMIELPRAALRAGAIAGTAEFFSFGTNDLTQTTFGFSRDDAAKFIDYYKTVNIMESDPFAVLDREGVGTLMKQAISGGRKTRPGIKLRL